MPASNDTAFIYPFIRYQDAPGAIDFLCNAFGFERVTVIREREKMPGDDLVSHLLRPGPGERPLTHDEVVGFCALLLMAGTETTTNALGNAIVLLHRHPEVRRQLVERPEGLARAIEELLRLESPVPGLSRVATRDVEIHGVTIPKGARVHMAFAAANRDPAIWENPDVYDIHRPRGQQSHLGFGMGPHRCLGLEVSKQEMVVAIEGLLDRFPNMKLDAEQPEPQLLGGLEQRGMSAIPVVLR